MKYFIILSLFASSCLSSQKFSYSDKLRTMKLYFHKDSTGILECKYRYENFSPIVQHFKWKQLADNKRLVINDSIIDEDNYMNLNLQKANKHNGVYFNTVPIIKTDTFSFVKDMVYFKKQREDNNSDILSYFVFRKGNKKVSEKILPGKTSTRHSPMRIRHSATQKIQP